MDEHNLTQQLAEAAAKRDRRLVKLTAHFELPLPNRLLVEQQIQQDYMHEVRVLRRAFRTVKPYSPPNLST